MTIPDKAVEAAARAYYEHLGWDWDVLDTDTKDHAASKDVILSEFTVALEAAEPHLREQVAEEIAVALDAVPGLVYPEDIFTPDGTTVDAQSARVMRFAYPAAANLAREIGGVKP